MKHSQSCHGVIGSRDEQPFVKQRGPRSSVTTLSLDATHRRLAWLRMYLDFGELELAVACFRTTATDASPCERELHQAEAMRLAGRLAAALGIAEGVDVADYVLSFASAWDHAPATAGHSNDRSTLMVSIGRLDPYDEDSITLVRSRPLEAA